MINAREHQPTHRSAASDDQGRLRRCGLLVEVVAHTAAPAQRLVTSSVIQAVGAQTGPAEVLAFSCDRGAVW